MRSTQRVLILAVVAASAGVAGAQASRPAGAAGDLLSPAALEQPLRDVEARLAQLAAEPAQRDDVRFALGVARLLRAVEKLGQSLHKYGFQPDRGLGILGMVGMPAPMFPVPPNPKPEPISFDDVRRIQTEFRNELREVDETLATVRDEQVKLPLPIGLVRLDLDGDTRATDDESLWRIYSRVAGIRDITPEQAREFVIVFDRADVEWLRGYCRLLRALLEISIAYDERELFERTGHLLFPNVKSPYAFLARPAAGRDRDEMGPILDLIAAIHLIRFPLREPERLKVAHEHLLAMIAHSRAMWRFVRDESDDDHEWIPSPRQQSVLGLRFTDEMVKGWEDALQEMEALLNGTKLIPFWRNDPRGVSLKMVFLEPQDFDLVLWVQGSGAAPFLEEGPKTTPETWERFEQIFEGRFIAFAAWVN